MSEQTPRGSGERLLRGARNAALAGTAALAGAEVLLLLPVAAAVGAGVASTVFLEMARKSVAKHRKPTTG